MKRTLPALLLALGACGQFSTDQGGAAPTMSASGQTQSDTANAALQSVSNTATETSQVASSIGKNALAANAAGVAQTADALATDLAGKSAAKSATVDLPSRLEYKDVTTELGDPEGMRALVPYLLHPETWMLIKCEMLSATSKHYRFQRVRVGDGRALPEVDIFKGRK